MEDPEQLSTEEKDDYSEGDEVDLVAEVRLTTQVTKQDFIKTRHGNVRCFPHCSLVHNERTFCGDSVFASIKGLHPGKHAHVLGEFRQKEHEPSLQIGQVISDEVRKDFLEATLVSRDANEERIRFSFNPPRKWEYKQRPGARDRPDDLHVFTAFGIVNYRVVGMDHTAPFTLTPIWRNQHSDGLSTPAEDVSPIAVVDVPSVNEISRPTTTTARPESTRQSAYRAPFNPLQTQRVASSSSTSLPHWQNSALSRSAPQLSGQASSSSSNMFPLISQIDLNKPSGGLPGSSTGLNNMILPPTSSTNAISLPTAQGISMPSVTPFGQSSISPLFAPNMTGLGSHQSAFLAAQQQQQTLLGLAQQQQQQAFMAQQQQQLQQTFVPFGQIGVFPPIASQQPFGGSMINQPTNHLIMGGFNVMSGFPSDQMQTAYQHQMMFMQQQFQSNIMQQHQQSLFGPPSAWSVDSSKAVSYGKEEEQRQAREMESRMQSGNLNSKKSRADLQQSWN